MNELLSLAFKTRRRQKRFQVFAELFLIDFEFVCFLPFIKTHRERVMTWRLLGERSRKSRSFNVRLVWNRLLNLIIAHEFSINWQALGAPLSQLLPQASNDLLGLWHVRLICLRRLDVDVLRLWSQDRLNGMASADNRLQEGLFRWHGVGLIGFMHLGQVVQLGSDISWRIYNRIESFVAWEASRKLVMGPTPFLHSSAIKFCPVRWKTKPTIALSWR